MLVIYSTEEVLFATLSVAQSVTSSIFNTGVQVVAPV
jgi:hypothetical protein